MRKKMTLEKNVRTQRGFSVVELSIAVAIMLVLLAMAVPSVLQSIHIFRLNSAATSLQNIMEITRFSAVRKNTEIALRQTTLNGQQLFYVDLNGTGAYANTDPSYLLPLDIEWNPAGAPAASTTNLASTQALASGDCIAFDARGVVSYATCGAGTQVVWFMSVGLLNNNDGYRAVTVTPMGQAKAWTASSAGSWGTM